jgi:hypothetical protein
MSRSSTRTCAGLLAVVAVALLGTAALAADEPAPAQSQEPAATPGSAQAVWSEWVGFELSGFSNIFTNGRNGISKYYFAPGPSLFLRGPTRRWDWLYWTTVELGGGLFIDHRRDHELGGGHASLGSELGIIAFDNGSLELTAGLGLAGGLQGFVAGYGANGMLHDDAQVGGFGLIFSPVVKLRIRATESLTLGLTFRALVPTLTGEEDNCATFLVALDIGIR